MDVGQSINGKYRIVRLIGDGGMGSVYEAHHQVLGVNVALKFLHSDLSEAFNLKERFLQEARVSATIQSPHIVRVLDVDVFEGQPYLVMDLLKGEPLQRRMVQLGRLTVPQTLEYAQQILLGLQEAHDKNVVHRDLKPDNVFITKGARGEELLKILDFGIAKLKQDAGVKANLTQPGAVMGTPEYMAPEQAYSADQVDARSDVYSVGVMLFEMLSGKRPADGETPQEIAHKVLMGQGLRLEDIAPDVPAGLARVVQTAMEPRPEDRWADARALREALLPFAPTSPYASTGVSGQPLTGQGVPFVQVSKTPRIDGVRTPGQSDRPPTRVDNAGSGSGRDSGLRPTSTIEIPIDIVSQQVPATIPPSAGPPRASELPPEPAPIDPALAQTQRHTADMLKAPELRQQPAGGTVNFEARSGVTVGSRATGTLAQPGPVINYPGAGGAGLRPTTVTRRSTSNWGLWATLATVLIGSAGALGYYYYETEYNAPIPPPRPVRRANYVAARGETPAAPAQATNQEAAGPTQLQPLDPGALEDNPELAQRWKNNPVPPAPVPNPAGPGATNRPAGAATGTGAAPTGAPVFTLPTAIPLPTGSLPIALPTSLPQLPLPSGFSIPGLTPPAPAANSR